MDAKPRRWVRLKVVVSAIVFAVVTVAVLGVAWLNPAIRQGNSQDFWNGACGVCLDGNYQLRKGWRYEVFPAREGWLVFKPTGFICGGSPIYRIREEEAFADFPRVVEQLHRVDPTDLRLVGITNWREKDPDATAPRLFLQEVRTARLDAFRQLDAREGTTRYASIRSIEQGVDERYRLAHDWRPVQVVIELIYFAALAAFVLWPWWRSAAWHWYAVHLAWLPWLFLLPFWLGYAPLAGSRFVSAEDGILYPALITMTPRIESLGEPDEYLARQIPRPLVSLPGNPGPAALPFISVQKGRGPLAALVWGVAFCSPLFLGLGVRACIRQYRRRTAREPDDELDERPDLKWWMETRPEA